MKYLLITLAFLLWWLQPAPVPYRLEIAPGGMERIEARKKYHGVKSAVCGIDGCWFERDGKKIRL
jgi:hypothetical protein